MVAKPLERTDLDVAPVDRHPIVPVRAALLVVEAEGVQELVHDGRVARRAGGHEGQALRPALAPDVRRTAARYKALITAF